MEKREIIKENYPESLREIPKTPEKLFVIGEIPEAEIYLGIVGTRKNSHYGKEVTEKIIEELSNLLGDQIVTVSGLAYGIDTIVHKASIKNNIRTIAIPGSGLDKKVLYPKENHNLADEIIKNGGALISEFTWDYPASTYTFPQRNRIIAGLSRGVLVIEAPEKSGALITANFALDFNREVFAVPGPIFSENSKGTNKLIKEGAIPVTCGKDILEAWGIDFEEEKGEILLEGMEKEIWEILSEPTEKDLIIQKIGRPTSEISSAVALMEIKGLIKSSGGKIYRNH